MGTLQKPKMKKNRNSGCHRLAEQNEELFLKEFSYIHLFLLLLMCIYTKGMYVCGTYVCVCAHVVNARIFHDYAFNVFFSTVSQPISASFVNLFLSNL